MNFTGLEALEGRSDAPGTVRIDGKVYTLPAPYSMHYREVLGRLHAGAPPLPHDVRLAEWKRAALLAWWSARHDLPPFPLAQRLAALLDRYRSELSNDLRVHAGVDLATLWRARRWQTLLDLIDHLPTTSWYNAAIVNDEEHAKALAEAMSENDGEDRKGPRLQDWTPEVAAITNLSDQVATLTYLVARFAGSKDSPPEPLPRPDTVLAREVRRADFERRQARHEALAARVLRRPRSGD